MAIKGTLLALRIVSTRDVAVMMCEEPEVKDVKRKTLPSLSHALRSCAEAMSECVSTLSVFVSLRRERRVFASRGPCDVVYAQLCGVPCLSSIHKVFIAMSFNLIVIAHCSKINYQVYNIW
jgi:hypothetical protein